MKKRILTLLAVVALLVVCAAFTVSADAVDLTTFKCPCAACTAARAIEETYVLDEAEWITEFTTTPVDGGHYYITTSQNTVTAQINAPSGGEAVYLLDNAYLCRTGSGRLLGGNGGNLHIIGNGGNAVLLTKDTSSNNGTLGMVSSAGEIHLYGQLTVKWHGDCTATPTHSGLFRLYSGLVHIHDGEGLGLPTDKDPILTPGNLANTTSSLGGVAYLENANCTFIMDAGTLNGTSQCYRGSVLYNAGGVVTINGGTINGGIAGNRGAIMNASGTLNINGGTIKGNVNQTASYRSVVLAGGTCNFAGGTIISPNKGLGDGIAITSGVLKISGTATVKNNEDDAKCTWDNNIWRYASAASSCVIQVDSEWTGSASVYIPNHSLTNHGGGFETAKLKYGTIADDGAFTAGTSTTAKLTGMRLENDDHDNPQLAGYQGLVVTCRAALFEDGKLTAWSVVPSGAVLDYVESDAAEKYVKLWADYQLNINTTIYMDLNGRTYTKLTHGANGKIYAFDSTTAAGGVSDVSVTTGNAYEVIQPVTQIGGKTYVYNDSKIYNVGLEISHVTLRSTANDASLYYTAAFNMHDDLKSVVTAGVAVTLKDDASATDLADYLYTEDVASNGEYTSAIVKGIINKDGDENGDRAVKPIYARAYISVDGKVAMSDAANWSLNRVVNAVTAKYNAGEITDAGQIAAYEALYAWCKDITLPDGEWTTKETI